MAILTTEYPITKYPISVDCFDKCICGGKFRFFEIRRRGKNTFEGVSAECRCGNTFFAGSENDLLYKINNNV